MQLRARARVVGRGDGSDSTQCEYLIVELDADFALLAFVKAELCWEGGNRNHGALFIEGYNFNLSGGTVVAYREGDSVSVAPYHPGSQGE